MILWYDYAHRPWLAVHGRALSFGIPEMTVPEAFFFYTVPTFAGLSAPLCLELYRETF